MHRHGFYRMSRTVQAAIRCGDDVAHLADLDRKYWLALSCPARQSGCASPVAAVLDVDGDQRVRVPEVLGAVEWLRLRLSSFDRLFIPSDALTAEDLRTDTAEGKTLADLLQMLSGGMPLAETALDGAIDAFRKGKTNGDGVIPAEGPLAGAVLAVTGGTAACDATRGISRKDLADFRDAFQAYRAWTQARPALAESLGGLAPAEAVALVARLAPKVEAYFLACRLVGYNPAAREQFLAPVPADRLAEAPLALPNAEQRPLDAKAGVNPLWIDDVAALQCLLGAESVTEEGLARAKALTAPYAAWAAAKPAGAKVFEEMARAGTLALAESPEAVAALDAALAEDETRAPLAAAFEDLRRFLVLRFGFLRFLHNFVNVEDLYPPTARPLFLTGTLYMDGRACSLCFPVDKAAAAHAAAAADSHCCLVYCTLTRPAENRTRTILAVFTAGAISGLTVGRNGIFFDQDGKDWEATVCHVAPNVINLAEAFFAPWRKVGAAVTDTLHKFIASKNDAATEAMTTKATAATTAVAAGGQTPAPAAPNGAMMASVATLGIALSFMGTMVATIASALTHTPVWKTALIVLSLVLAVSLPSVILTWLKLRSRDLAPILNASGWAVNRSIGLTTRLGAFFTQRASYIGRRFTRPPLRERRSFRAMALAALFLALLAVAAWYFFCPCSPRNRCTAACGATAPETAETPPESPAEGN